MVVQLVCVRHTINQINASANCDTRGTWEKDLTAKAGFELLAKLETKLLLSDKEAHMPRAVVVNKCGDAAF